MKKFAKFFAAAALVGGMMMTQSCSKTCDSGYEGSDCKTLWSTKMAKTWSTTETPTAGGATGSAYGVVISNSVTNGVDLSIDYLGKYLCNTTGGSQHVVFKGTMTSSTAFSINDSTCGYKMTGQGTLAGGKITGSYVATYSLAGVPQSDSYAFIMQ